jgi:hypothetical protein
MLLTSKKKKKNTPQITLIFVVGVLLINIKAQLIMKDNY